MNADQPYIHKADNELTIKNLQALNGNFDSTSYQKRKDFDHISQHSKKSAFSKKSKLSGKNQPNKFNE